MKSVYLYLWKTVESSLAFTSFSVVKEIYQEGFPDFEQKEISKELLTSNGRSYTVPIENEDGSYNPEKSRRVEFLFRLKEDERIEAIQKLVTDE